MQLDIRLPIALLLLIDGGLLALYGLWGNSAVRAARVMDLHWGLVLLLVGALLLWVSVARRSRPHD